ncbi:MULTISPECIES: NAD(P)-dependent alcohol dehydrogenase [Nonomuraea]|uniref:NAD(P)-dependent alcohol dehydrogenase n=1 Tax=Nonomuraea TaxID=83681 RepID=UPI001C5D8727|nr:NAD(P)-dependent alcohol dehydrogenase [Nonomuraea ceibae]
MKAVQLAGQGSMPEVVTVPDPEPAPGEVLLRVRASGMCHSDIAVIENPLLVGGSLPLILGHEGAGTVAALGDGVTGVEVGQDVVVYGPWGCGTCRNCSRGAENYCTRAQDLAIKPPGLGAPGAMAEYMIVDDVRHLVPVEGLDLAQAAPLTDAGLTPYHAIKRSLAKLVPGSTAVVIGTGGLGHMAVQILRAMSATRVIALDISEEKLELAREIGAHETVISDEAAAGRVRELTGGLGADLVLDFVGIQPTVTLAGACAGVCSDVTIVGVADGRLPVGFGSGPYEMAVSVPYWGGRDELIEVLALARSGAIGVRVEPHSLDEAPRTYQRLHDNEIVGRAVIVP